MQTIFSKAEEIRNEGRPAAICIVVETSGSTPRKPGSKMIVYADGKITGSIGGGSVEKEVTDRAVELIASGKPQKCQFRLEEDLGMHCGGMMEVYIEPINTVQRLYIYGAGHVGKAVAKFAAGGKPAGKKDLGLMMMSYGNAYIATVAMGYNDAQTVRAFIEAEAFNGPSLIIAYAHCIAHGIDMSKGLNQQKLAVESGAWILYRYNPALAAQGKNPLQIDSREPSIPLKDYIYS